MYVTATKTQAEAIISGVSVTNVLYSKLGNNVTGLALAAAGGWLVVTVVGLFDVDELMEAQPGAVEVSSVHS